MTEHMLTTDDNPYNPFTEWDDWDTWDKDAGYNTTAYLARVVRTSDELPEAVRSQAIEDAISEVLEFNLSGNYIRVTAPKTEESKAS